jgi:hypothetical protein
LDNNSSKEKVTMSKVKITSVTPFLLCIKPNHGKKGEGITLAEGKSHTFKTAEEYSVYEKDCVTFVNANPPKLKITTSEDKKKVKESEPVAPPIEDPVLEDEDPVEEETETLEDPVEEETETVEEAPETLEDPVEEEAETVEEEAPDKPAEVKPVALMEKPKNKKSSKNKKAGRKSRRAK